MLHSHISSEAELAIARAEIEVALVDLDLDVDHIRDVETVADELIASAMDARAGSVQLFVEVLDAITRVRVRCEHYVDIDPLGSDLRRRVLEALTVSVGHDRNALGTVDLWADLEPD